MMLDKVAKAICDADQTSSTWDKFVEEYGIDCFSCKRFRRMAQAALDALTEVWVVDGSTAGCCGGCDGYCQEYNEGTPIKSIHLTEESARAAGRGYVSRWSLPA